MQGGQQRTVSGQVELTVRTVRNKSIILRLLYCCLLNLGEKVKQLSPLQVLIRGINLGIYIKLLKVLFIKRKKAKYKKKYEAKKLYKIT